MPDSSRSISTTLLQRAQRADHDAFKEIYYIFKPTVIKWCRYRNLGNDDAEDVCHEVFTIVFTKIDRFRREAPGQSFSGWLYTISSNTISDRYKKLAKPGEGAGIGGTNARQMIENVHDKRILNELPECEPAPSNGKGCDEMSEPLARVLELIRPKYKEKNWKAFMATAVEVRPPRDVAADLGMSIGAVYKAKSRILSELRDRYNDLLDEFE